jgi:DNA modification methylase
VIVCGDNLDVLARVADGSVDLVYADPPYGTGVVRRGRDGTYDDRTPGGMAAYVDWLHPRLVEFRRVLAPTGSLFVHLDWRASHYVKVELDRIFGAARFLNEIVWCYSVGGKSRRLFGRKHDTILWYAKGEAHAFYPDQVRIARKPGSHMKVELDPDGRPVQVKRDARTGKLYRYPVHAGKIPEDYWTDIETLNRGDRERTGYPTQKPEALLERIVKSVTRPGDLVLDVFCGSGTTAVVAHRLGRRFLVADVSVRAVEITRARLGRTSARDILQE